MVYGQSPIFIREIIINQYKSPISMLHLNHFKLLNNQMAICLPAAWEKQITLSW